MAQHAILRFSKGKGGSVGRIEAHHERTKEQYASNPDIQTEKSKQNFHLIAPTAKYRREISTRIKQAGCKTRKDSTLYVDTLITASPDFFRDAGREQIRDYFTHALHFLNERIGAQNIFSAVVHMDERTPHMHLCFTPITRDGRLSAKDILGNRAKLSKWQDDFHAHMSKTYPDLERGEPALITKRKHIPTWLFKQSVALKRQVEALEQALQGFTPFNIKRKREEVLTLFGTLFPKLSEHLGQVQKYQGTIDYMAQKTSGLERENRTLRRGAQAHEEESFEQSFQISKLQSECKRLQRFIEHIPPDIKRQLRKQKEKNEAER